MEYEEAKKLYNDILAYYLSQIKKNKIFVHGHMSVSNSEEEKLTFNDSFGGNSDFYFSVSVSIHSEFASSGSFNKIVITYGAYRKNDVPVSGSKRVKANEYSEAYDSMCKKIDEMIDELPKMRSKMVKKFWAGKIAKVSAKALAIYAVFLLGKSSGHKSAAQTLEEAIENGRVAVEAVESVDQVSRIIGDGNFDTRQKFDSTYAVLRQLDSLLSDKHLTTSEVTRKRLNSLREMASVHNTLVFLDEFEPMLRRQIDHVKTQSGGEFSFVNDFSQELFANVLNELHGLRWNIVDIREFGGIRLSFLLPILQRYLALFEEYDSALKDGKNSRNRHMTGAEENRISGGIMSVKDALVIFGRS